MDCIILLHLEQPVDDLHFVSRQRLSLYLLHLSNAGGTDPVAPLDEGPLLFWVVLVPDLMANLIGEDITLLTESFLGYLDMSTAVGYHLGFREKVNEYQI